MRHGTLKFLLVVFTLLVVGCGEESTTAAKQAAPDFAIKTFDGGDFRLSEQNGKRVILNFFASWCTTCGTELPDIEAAYHELKDENVVFVGVAIDDSTEKAKAFVKKKGLTYITGIDTDGSIKKNYAIYGLPFTFFIDQQGFIQTIHAGAVNEGLLALELEKMTNTNGDAGYRPH